MKIKIYKVFEYGNWRWYFIEKDNETNIRKLTKRITLPPQNRKAFESLGVEFEEVESPGPVYPTQTKITP